MSGRLQVAGPSSRKGAKAEVAPLTSPANIALPPSAKQRPVSPHGYDSFRMANTLCLYNPTYGKRRRSVDTGGLATAMRRAQRIFELAPARKDNNSTGNLTFPLAPDAAPPRRASEGTNVKEAEDVLGKKETEDDDETHTQLAELLSAMYYQTSMAIDVKMAEYAV
jgi:hypothetical protein